MGALLTKRAISQNEHRRVTEMTDRTLEYRDTERSNKRNANTENRDMI